MPSHKLRLAFARHHADDAWHNAAFHDGKKFYLRRSTKAVWHLRGEVAVVPQVKHPVSVNVCGARGRGGLSPIVIFGGTLTAAKLRVILEQYFVFNLAAITEEPEGPCRSFHDNDPKYRSATVTSLLDSVGVQDAGRLPSSPDVNVVEVIWHILNEKVQLRQPADKRAFVRTVKDEWATLPPSLLENLVDSLPRRLAAIKAAKGGNTIC